MKDEKTKSSIEVSSLDSFRRVTTILTLICSAVSVIIVCVEPRGCDSNPELKNAVIIALSV